MNINQFGGGGAAFFGAGFFQTATQQIQQAPMQQIQQLQSMLQSSFQNFFQAAGQFAGNIGGGFAQSPAASPGFVQAPGMGTMNPMNPSMMGQMGQMGMAGGGFVMGGFIAGGVGSIGTPQPPQGGLKQTGDNEYTTPGGYKIKAEGKDMAWTITTPEGKTTRIWGDPHVKEGDGGKWDFKKDMKFTLPDGTSIGVKTVPWGKDATVTGSIDIMHGNQRATIGNIDKNKDLSNSGIKNDRWAVDQKFANVDHAVMGGNGDDWFLNGKNEIVGGNMKTGEIYTKQNTANQVNQHALHTMQQNQMMQGQGGMPGMMPGMSMPSVGMPMAQQPGMMPGMGMPGMQQGMQGMPRFGGQQFMMQMVQQMMQAIMSQMQQMMGGMGMIR